VSDSLVIVLDREKDLFGLDSDAKYIYTVYPGVGDIFHPLPICTPSSLRTELVYSVG